LSQDDRVYKWSFNTDDIEIISSHASQSVEMSGKYSHPQC